jgi:histidinol-phosphate aminotransferase
MRDITDIKDLLQPHIRSLDTYQGVDPMEVLAQKAGIPADKVIRLNGNENPYGPSPKVIEALGQFKHYNLYPDPEQRRLRDALSEYLGVGPEHIVAGNGSDEIIDLVLRMFLGPGEKIIDPAPTFGMYAICARVCGGDVVTVPRDESFEIDLEATSEAIDPGTKAILFASPNNPTGNIAPEGQIRRLLDMGILVVVDETYYEFCGQTVLPLAHQYPNLIVLRTFSKWAGLAGLRIGLGVMHQDVSRVMMSMKPPYNVNLAAETALLASLEDWEMLVERVNMIVKERDRVFSALEGMPGVRPWPSQANFILCQLPQGEGERVFEALARRGIFLRHFSSPRMRDFVRASVGLPHENDALVAALDDILSELS